LLNVSIFSLKELDIICMDRRFRYTYVSGKCSI